METKHTPGPWHTGRNTVARNTIVYDSAGNAICDCKTFHGNHDDQAGSDNARLIAAAPLMLQALIDAEELIEDQVNSIESEIKYVRGTMYNQDDLTDAKEKLAAVREAIAKATQ